MVFRQSQKPKFSVFSNRFRCHPHSPENTFPRVFPGCPRFFSCPPCVHRKAPLVAIERAGRGHRGLVASSGRSGLSTPLRNATRVLARPCPRLSTPAPKLSYTPGSAVASTLLRSSLSAWRPEAQLWRNWEYDLYMTITLPLQPQEEARLIAAAQARGVSTDALVREAVIKILEESEKAEARPIWDVMLDNIKDVSAEEFAKLPKDGASEHDHYLYGHPKREQ
jgi:hypothetical protein